MAEISALQTSFGGLRFVYSIVIAWDDRYKSLGYSRGGCGTGSLLEISVFIVGLVLFFYSVPGVGVLSQMHYSFAL